MWLWLAVIVVIMTLSVVVFTCVKTLLCQQVMSWSVDKIFVDRLVMQPERGSVAELAQDAIQLAQEALDAGAEDAGLSLNAHIAWNMFVGAGRCHWLCLELCSSC